MKKNKKNKNEFTEALMNDEASSAILDAQEKEKKVKKPKKEKKPPETIVNKKESKNKDTREDDINFDELKDYGTAIGISEEKIKEISSRDLSKVVNKNTELVLNVKAYTKHIDYLPSDFTSRMVKQIFILRKQMNLPKKAKIKLQLTPNNTEKTLRVLASVNAYYKQGVVIEQTKIFEPFWILGFGTYSLIVSLEQPMESRYRVNSMHSFSFAQTQKMRKKKVFSRHTSKSKTVFEAEEDFYRARNNKNWYLQQYADELNRLKNVEWECHPKVYINWTTRTIKIDLFLKIDKIKVDLRKTRWVYVDSFNVKANNVLDIPRDTKLVDIDAIMYLIALNAVYKNIKIFSYKTLYETYKAMCYEMLSKGFQLKPISPRNLETLKIVDFSKHLICNKTIFNDSILHIMNLMSSQEDYYRMKYAYTVQKDPSLLFSDFIVKEFRNVKTSELSTIIKNQEDKYWKEQLKKIDELNNNVELKNKDFYINNYNVLDLTNNAYKDVESFLMGVIKGEKDEITRISKLGQELLRIDEDPRFTKKESAELRKVAKKLDDNYRDLFKDLSPADIKKAAKVKPIKIEEVRTKKSKKNKHDDVATEQPADQQTYDGSNYEGVNNG